MSKGPKNILNNSIKFFGASLDALDTHESVSIKRTYIESLSFRESCQPDLRDPYSLFRKVMGNQIEEFGHKNLGRFAVDSWLTPKPQESDIDLILEESYKEFLTNDGFRAFSELLKDFVKAHIFPCIPGMIGVDHSLTGGILMALSEWIGPENLVVLVFDVHTDAIPLPIRSGLVNYALEAGLPSPGPISISPELNPYAAGNFLFYLIEEGKILPQNLIIVGTRDGTETLRNLDDRRVKEYVHHYNSLSERGVKIISRDQLRHFGTSTIGKILDQIKCTNLYISLDVDVSAQCGVLATRFFDLVGSETNLILETALKIAELLSSNRYCLVGLDIMEIDIHKIGIKLRSGVEDKTEDFIQKFILNFMSCFCKKTNSRLR
jgi:arginase family enzyme